MCKRHHQTASLEQLLVKIINGVLGDLGGLEFNICKSSGLSAYGHLNASVFTDPLLRPRTSLMSRTVLIVPNRENSFSRSFSVTSKNKLPTYIVGLGVAGSRAAPPNPRVRSETGEEDVSFTALFTLACSADLYPLVSSELEDSVTCCALLDSLSCCSAGAVVLAALSSWIAFSTSSCGVGCSSETGTLSGSEFFASASADAHLRWYWTGTTILEGRDDTEVKVVIVRGLAIKVDGRDTSRRVAACLIENLV